MIEQQAPVTESSEPPESNFAEFETKAATSEPVEEAKEPDPVEKLEDFDAQPDETPEAKEKRRSKPLHQRLGETTEKWRNAEAKAADLEKRLAALEAGKPEPKAEVADELKAPDPNDEKYEFGEADPNYLADLTDYKVDKRLADRDKANSEKDSEKAGEEARVEAARGLDTKWAAQEKAGVEKYDDFATVVDDFKANAPCPPLMAAAISDSPVGADVTYHLAKNQPTAQLLAAKLASGDVIGAATAFGELEGQFLDAAPDKPATAHPLDMAIFAGRLRGFMAKPKGKVATDAPEPPQHRVRGGSGQFEVSGDTTDFAAFERKANAASVAKR